MPSEDSWFPLASNHQNVYSGRVRTWNNTPGWRSLTKEQKKNLQTNGYSDVRRFATQQKFSEWQYTWNYTTLQWDLTTFTPDRLFDLNGIYSFYNWKPNGTSFDTEWSTSLIGVENDLGLKALVKIADAKVNIAVAYAEAHKTSKLIYDTASRIDRAYRAFRRGDLKGIARNLGITPSKLHNSWLEYKYGWMPLLMDVKGAAEFFAQQQVVRPPRFTVVATKEIVKRSFKPFTYSAPGFGGPETATELIERRWDGKVKITCELSSPHLSELQQIGVTNPALVAWELVPFSFVFDWFISVGDWLTGLTALQGVNVLTTCYSQLTSENWEQAFPAYDRHDTSYRYKKENMWFRMFTRTYSRVPFDLNPLNFTPKVSTDSYGFPKLVTSLALLKANHRGNARL